VREPPGQFAGVDVDGSTPVASSPSVPSSWGSLNIPTCPLKAGSKRSFTDVISRPVFEGSYPMAVSPDCQAIVYLLPGSHDGSLIGAAAFS
jgi:hypothetical protein